MNYKTTKTTEYDLTPNDIEDIIRKHLGVGASAKVEFKIGEKYTSYDDFSTVKVLSGATVKIVEEDNNEYYNR